MASIEGIYPCGEGAGYAGGITTSAIDGIKVAEAIIGKYKIQKKDYLTFLLDSLFQFYGRFIQEDIIMVFQLGY